MRTSTLSVRRFVLPLLFAAAVPGARAQSPAIAAVASPIPLGLTVEEAYSDTLRYDFGTTASGRHFHLDVVFRPGEVEWWELWDGGTTEIDPTKAVLLDAHRLLASWPEANGWFITLYADFARGESSFCGTNGTSSQCRTGTIARADAGSDDRPPGPAGPVYVIADITVHDPTTYARYRNAIAPVIAAHGGRYLVRSGAARFDGDDDAGVVSPEGAWTPDRLIVLEFPSRAAFDGYVASPEYRAVAPLRAASATTRSVVASGYAPSR